MPNSNNLIPPHGGFKKRRSFAVALAVNNGTSIFADRFIPKKSRTHDQMVQAARSGIQNIVEGALASATSKKTEIKLTNVAKASLGELIRDYEDFLRQKKLNIWDKNPPRFKAMRLRLAGKLPPPQNIESINGEDCEYFDEPLLSALEAIKTVIPEVAANIMLCRVNQASYLLYRQIKRLEDVFLEHCGFTENMYRQRQARRRNQMHDPQARYLCTPSAPSDLSVFLTPNKGTNRS